jgi:signal transduction histidine kinase
MKPMNPPETSALERKTNIATWLLALALSLAIVATVWAVEKVDADPQNPAVHHFTQAEVHVEVIKGAEGMSVAQPRVLDLATLPQSWVPVALPYVWSRTEVAGERKVKGMTLRTWVQVSLEGVQPVVNGLYLYLPRWQTAGRVAVYGDDRLLYRSNGDVVWSAFNYPLWVPLDPDGTSPVPKVLRLRIDSLAGAGGAVSSVWIGPEEALAPMVRLRGWLQTGIAEVLNVAALGLGAFAFAVWTRRRHERTYLLFALFTLFWVLRSLRYHVGLEPLPISSAWFGWLTVNSGNALLLTWYFFVATLVPTAPRWPKTVLLALLVASSVATLPLLADQAWVAPLLPLAYATTVMVGSPMTLLMLWAALRYGGREGIVAALIGLFHLPLTTHDVMLQNFVQNAFLSPENLYAWPLSTVARLLMFIYVILSRYVRAVDATEQANVHLAQRLRAREMALAESHEKLRLVQQRQLLHAERQRLMQDIHDGMGSQLMRALHVAEAGKLSETQMAQVLRECIDDLKLTVDSLDPTDADLLLLATLRYRLAPRLEAAGLRLQWDVADVPALEWLDPRSALHVLRILQEGIGHIIQHANATALRVLTGEADGGVYVQLIDNGKGFDAQAQAMASADKEAPTMQRRAHAVGGTVTWQSLPDGTLFRLWLPLHKRTEAAAA